MLVALLCILTTALFALVDASASSRGPAQIGDVRVGSVVSSDPDRRSAVAVADRAMADLDDPFDHGRLPLAGTAVPSRVSGPGEPTTMVDEGAAGIDTPLPERPPRA